MGLAIDESAKAHHSTDKFEQENKSTKPVGTPTDQKQGGNKVKSFKKNEV